MRYARLWLAMFGLSAGLTCVLGPNPVSIVVYPIPIGVLVAKRRWGAVFGLLAGAGLAAFAGLGALWGILSTVEEKPEVQLSIGGIVALMVSTSVNYIFFSASGIPIGIGMARRWSYGRTVSVTTGIVFSVMTAYLVYSWPTFNSQLDALFEWFREGLRKSAETAGTDVSSEQLDLLHWLQDNKTALAIGFQFAVNLGVTCVLVSLTVGAMRRWFADPGPEGSFRTMRPPDWLVWLAIGAVVLWMFDQQWPNYSIRFVSWNMAVGVGTIYVLNGLSIFLYGLHVLAPGFLVLALVIMLVASIGLLPVLGAVGFSDTWIDFRIRCDRLAEAIRSAGDGRDK